EFDIDLRSTGSITKPYFDQGYTVIYAAIGEEIKGLVIIKNQPALELKEVIGDLKKSSIKTILLTGDNEPTASWYTSEFNLAGYIPLASPIEKSQALGRLKELENSIGIVDVSENRLMLTQVKESQSQPVFMTNLDQVPKLIKLGQVYTRQCKKIIFDSLLYHGLTIPLATGILLGLGIMPAPAVAALISTGFVLVLQQRKI
ncbi:MAG TPA: hypothetical protein VEA37_05270, partial [Flavobacterium sp.]|nr:hypothetical protein [Flavobacterium sp.]